MTQPDTVLRTAVMQWLNELTPEARQALIAEVTTTTERKHLAMSLESLESEIDGLRTQAEELRDEWDHTATEIANDTSLSAEGKRDYLEPLHQELTEKISGLRNKERTLVTRTRETLERSAFGLPATASSDAGQISLYREAQSRAAALTRLEDAEDEYRNALRSDDHTLAKAILSKAVEYNWRSIIDDYAERNPGLRTTLDGITQLTKFQNNSLANITHYIVPTLNLEHSAGFPQLKPLNASRAPQVARPLRAGFGTW